MINKILPIRCPNDIGLSFSVPGIIPSPGGGNIVRLVKPS